MLLKENEAKERSVNVANIAGSKALLQTFRKLPGVDWWELKLETGEVNKVDFDSVTAGYKAGVQNRVDIKPMTLYCPAINKRNAEKKFSKMVLELSQQGKVLQWIVV